MTIGKSSKKIKAARAPSFLDRAGGFYGRLDEPEPEAEMGREGEMTGHGSETLRVNSVEQAVSNWQEIEEHGALDFGENVMDDDGTTTLLKRKPSRLSRRWSRRSTRKAKTDKLSPERELQSPATETPAEVVVEVLPDPHSELEPKSQLPEPMVVHFAVMEEADDQVLISKRREREKELEEKRTEKTADGKTDTETMKVAKRSTLKTYRKALDRALRRGWETFVANLHSVTLTPVTSSSSSSSSSSSPSKSGVNRNAVLAEFQ